MDVSNKLEAMFHRREGGRGIGDLFKTRSCPLRHQRRRHNVFVVVTASQAKIVNVQKLAALHSNHFAIQPCAGNLVGSAEPDGFRFCPHGERHRNGIVGIEHREIVRPLRLEQTGLGVRVVFEGVVTVQMILRHVKTGGDGRAECLDGFQLEA